MANVPYLFVNITAVCLYSILLFAFLAAKKTPEIRSFILVLVGFILWTGGSILMRLQTFPGVSFWFYVSLMALFSCGLLLYFFICSFARVRGFLVKLLWTIGNVILLILTPFGIFLKPPTVQTQPDGSTVFLYDMDWHIAIPCVFFAALVFCMFVIFRRLIREKGFRSPGVPSIIIGCIAIGVGNMIQIIPGNIFPWDTLSGLIFAIMLMLALYRKRMFRMTLIVSRSVLMLICALLCILAAAYFVIPLQDIIVSKFGVSSNFATAAIVVIFTLALACVYMLLRKLVDTLFTREEHQGRLLNDFSSHVSQTLATGEVMAELVNVIREEIQVERTYILLPDSKGYTAKFSSNPLDSLAFSIAKDSPCIAYLKSSDNRFVVSDFQKSPLYLSMWEEEKDLLRRMDIGCVVALHDASDIVGLVLLSNKDKNASFSYVELSFLDTVCSIASIALKNASLYEQVYREARIDSLTNVYNYKYFVEKINQDFSACGNDCLSLLYLDLDDFKLFNQLHGTSAGDKALRSIAEIITRLAGEDSTVFRHSGKVFAVLLPGRDAREADTLAREIQRRVRSLNICAGTDTKPLTISGGICSAPYAASSAKELMENADLAVYNAKQQGKGCIVTFRPQMPTDTLSIAERTAQILERVGHAGSSYETISPTVFALTAAIDAKDSYTCNHSQNVARYASILATAAGLSDEQIRIVYEAGLLHDIGKISIPENVLRKPGVLTDDEFELMKTHVNNSVEMIRHLPSMDYVIPAAVTHHERWDGKGYPRRIAGEDIPITGRCLAVADAFDAMTTDRPYRKGLSLEYAANQIETGAGTQFDPRLAGIFVKLLRTGDIGLPNRDI